MPEHQIKQYVKAYLNNLKKEYEGGSEPRKHRTKFSTKFVRFLKEQGSQITIMKEEEPKGCSTCYKIIQTNASKQREVKKSWIQRLSALIQFSLKFLFPIKCPVFR